VRNIGQQEYAETDNFLHKVHFYVASTMSADFTLLSYSPSTMAESLDILI